MAAEGGDCRVLVGVPPDRGGSTQHPYVALQTPEAVTTYSVVPEGRPQRAPDGGLVAGPGLLLENSVLDRERCGAALAGEPGHSLAVNAQALSPEQLAAVRAAAVEPYQQGEFRYGAGHTSCADLPLAAMNAAGRAQQGEREVAGTTVDGVPAHEACQYAEHFAAEQAAVRALQGPGGGPAQREGRSQAELADGAAAMDSLMSPVRTMFEFLGVIPEEERAAQVEVEGREPPGAQPERGAAAGPRGPGGDPGARSREGSLEEIERRAAPSPGAERGE